MTKNACIYLILFLFLGGAWAGCAGCFGSDDAETDRVEDSDTNQDGDDPDDPQTAVNDAVQQAQQAAQQAQQAVQDALGNTGVGTVKESVDFRKLRDLLPEEIAGLDRTNAEGERTGIMGMQFSSAKGRYEGSNNARFNVNIADLGTLTGIARMGFNAWLQTEIDRESDRGFERTSTIEVGGNEYPYYEKFESDDGEIGRCEVKVWVAERFIVDIEGYNVEFDQCEEARDEVEYRQLDRMRNEGVESE